MIPIRQHNDEEARANEPEEIRQLTKKALHFRLSNEYYIPEHTTRGVNRDYLVGVFRGDYFRVPLLEYKRFDAELTPAQKKKCPILNGIDAVSKINRLLVETNRRPLGFPDGLYPDEKWFLGIARYIDQVNVTGIFLEPVANAPPIECISTRMVRAKREAERFLMGERQLLNNPSVYNQVKEVWESQKRLVSKRMELEALVSHGRLVETKIHDEESNLNSKILNTSMSIFTYGNNMNNAADQIFHEQDGNAHRLQLAEITRMLKFIYVADPILNREAWALELCNRFAPTNPQPVLRNSSQGPANSSHRPME